MKQQQKILDEILALIDTLKQAENVSRGTLKFMIEYAYNAGVVHSACELQKKFFFDDGDKEDVSFIKDNYLTELKQKIDLLESLCNTV